MLKLRHKMLVNIYSVMYALCLWGAIYFVHDRRDFTFHFLNSDELTIGVIFLAWVSTFRDLAQMSGLRFRSVLVLCVTCVYLLIIYDSKVAYAAIAALFWTELLDFFIFTGLFRYWCRYDMKRIVAAVVISDIITIPALWFTLLTFLGYPMSALPKGTLTAQYAALCLLYAVLALIYIPNGRWKRYLNVPKAS